MTNKEISAFVEEAYKDNTFRKKFVMLKLLMGVINGNN